MNTRPSNPSPGPTCYVCHQNPPNRHSVFCDQCLRAVSPLHYRPARQSAGPLTRALYLGAIATTVYLIFKAAEVAMNP